MATVMLLWVARARQGVGGLVWECRRAARRFLRAYGAWGVGVVLALLLVTLAWGVARYQVDAAKAAQTRWAKRGETTSVKTDTVLSDGRSRLQRFEATLLQHDDLPSQVQDLLNLAEDENLTVTRGEYRPQADVQGRFMRYRMNMPVRGDGQAVYRFIEAALSSHPALGLESVQFQRERIESGEVEARIQWVVLARLPEGAETAPGTKAAR